MMIYVWTLPASIVIIVRASVYQIIYLCVPATSATILQTADYTIAIHNTHCISVYCICNWLQPKLHVWKVFVVLCEAAFVVLINRTAMTCQQYMRYWWNTIHKYRTGVGFYQRIIDTSFYISQRIWQELSIHTQLINITLQIATYLLYPWFSCKL